MAAKSNTTAPFPASVQNASRNAQIGETAAIEMGGYLITEDNDLALKDLSNALEAVATLCDEGGNMLPDMPGEMWAGLLRTFARQATAIHHEAAFANHATARPRADLN